MFTSSKVECCLNGFAGHGDDPEQKELKLVFHVNPITQALAREISPLLADRLFRLNPENEWVPAEEITKAAFSGITIQMQNITFYGFPEEDNEKGVLVPGCAISNLRASRPFVEARLEFDVVLPMNRETMRLVEKYYKANCFLTMEAIQREIKLEVNVEHQESLQEAADSTDGKSAGAGESKGRGRRKKTEEAVAT